MDYELIDRLKQRESILEQLIKDKQNAVECAPEGKLRISQSHGRTQYYYRLDPKDTIGTYIINDQKGLASDLAQKEYDKKILRTAREELRKIQSLITQYKHNDLASIYSQLSDLRRKIVCPILPEDDDYIASWESVTYEKKGFHEDTPEYFTAKGEQVRSKSELIIADTLHRRGIPYRYECPLSLKETGTIHPDFTVLNVRVRKEYYWEHLGMMDNPQYAQNALNRISNYEKHGYYPGELIMR